MKNNRIEINPRIMRGKSVIKGTRIPVYVVLNLLAEGNDASQIVREYPDLTKQDILSAIEYGSRMTRFEEVGAFAA